MGPLMDKEDLLKTIKEIFNFILAIIMFYSCIIIIVYGSARLKIGFLGFIPFIYFIFVFSKGVSKLVDKNENLENSLAYYKNRVQTYEEIYNDAIHKESL